jgi:hypothetical protein
MKKDRPLRVEKPLEPISPKEFAKWMSYTTSDEFLNPERLKFLKKMGDDLARDPALLKVVEHIFENYGDEIRRISPSDKELKGSSFGWSDESGAQALVPAAAAAAALAPPAAAMAAAHTPSE